MTLEVVVTGSADPNAISPCLVLPTLLRKHRLNSRQKTDAPHLFFSLSLMFGMGLIGFDIDALISINCTYQDGLIHNTLMYKITMT